MDVDVEVGATALSDDRNESPAVALPLLAIALLSHCVPRACARIVFAPPPLRSNSAYYSRIIPSGSVPIIPEEIPA